jgi:hypothetical protein
VLALRVAFPVTAFAAGWYGASRHTANVSSAPVKSSAPHNYRNATPPTTAVLDKARADLAAILKVTSPIERKRKLYDFAASLDTGTLQAMLAGMVGEPAGKPDHEAWSYLMGRWAELDPQAAIVWTQSLRYSPDKNVSMSEIFDAWSTQDPAAAMAAYAKLPRTGAFDFSLESIVDNMAAQDPQGALAALRSLPASQQDGFIYSYTYARAFGAWAKNDPTDAAAEAANLPPSSLRNSSLTSVAGAWAQQDPNAALAWANSLPAGAARQSAVSAAVEALGQQDPAEAADYASKLPSGGNNGYYIPGAYNRDQLLQNISQSWAQTDPSGLLTWADNNLTGKAFDTATNTAIETMGNTDPAAAAAALAQISDASVINQSVPALATAWAQQNVTAALTWAQSLPTTNDDVRQSALNNVLGTWTDTDPAGASAYLQQNLGTDPDFGKLASQLATNWGKTDPQAALAWAQSLPPGDAQNSTVAAAVSQLATVDPQAAWNDAQQLSGGAQDKTLGNVITAWADQQPDQAAEALANMPEGADLDTATTNVAKSWLRQDPDAASDWVDTLPEGTARDDAVTQVVSALSNKDPATAFDWATSIGNQGNRNKQVVKLATQWANQNPAAAGTAAQNALSLPGLTSAQQKTLQKIAAKAAGP